MTFVRPLLHYGKLLRLAQQLPHFRKLPREQFPKQRPHTHIREEVATAPHPGATAADIETLGDSKSYGAELQWDRRTAAELEAFVRVGAQNVKFEDGTKENSWLAGAGVSMPFGRNQLFADLVRSVGPSSAGRIITRDQLRLRWQRDFTPRLAFLLGLRGTHDEDISEVTNYRPRSYATGDIGLQWRWEQEFSLVMAYDYTWQKFDESATDPAKSGAASISVIYQPLQRRR